MQVMSERLVHRIIVEVGTLVYLYAEGTEKCIIHVLSSLNQKYKYEYSPQPLPSEDILKALSCKIIVMNTFILHYYTPQTWIAVWNLEISMTRRSFWSCYLIFSCKIFHQSKWWVFCVVLCITSLLQRVADAFKRNAFVEMTQKGLRSKWTM